MPSCSPVPQNYCLPNCNALLLQVADDEASHLQQLQQRLKAIGSFYGALPVHDGLWESAEATAHSLPARLAVESCVHEARGLDRLPHTIQRFRSSGDLESAALLEQIYQVQDLPHYDSPSWKPCFSCSHLLISLPVNQTVTLPGKFGMDGRPHMYAAVVHHMRGLNSLRHDIPQSCTASLTADVRTLAQTI